MLCIYRKSQVSQRKQGDIDLKLNVIVEELATQNFDLKFKVKCIGKGKR